jgi:hypothetical protein
VLQRLAGPPQPKKSRRHSGDDAGQQFVQASRRLSHWPVRPGAAAMARLWLADTLDWLDLWHSGTDELAGEPPESAANKHLSPRL